jgi:hypothetical protein
MSIFARIRAVLLDNVLEEDREAVGYAFDLALATLGLRL